MDNLNKRQQTQVFAIPEILQENCHLQKMTLSPDSVYAGKLIKDTDFRDNYNVSVVSVERGKQLVELPKSDFQLFPFPRSAGARLDFEHADVDVCAARDQLIVDRALHEMGGIDLSEIEPGIAQADIGGIVLGREFQIASALDVVSFGPAEKVGIRQ